MADLQEFAGVVALAIKAAMAPVLERVALMEAKVAEAVGVNQAVTELRERVVVAETKAAMPPSDGLPERVTALESKSLGPLPVPEDTADIRRRMEALEQRPVPAPSVLPEHVAEVRHRLMVIETKAAALETRVTQPDPLASVLDKTERAISELTKDVGALRERIAVVEVRAQVPGPAGKDGADGLGFEDMDVEFDGDRTITITAQRGTLKKAWPIVLPFQRNKGVYSDGMAYVAGDVVTWGGSQYHANEATTTKPGQGSKAWTLIVARGRDGKDGKDAVTVPVVTVGAR